LADGYSAHLTQLTHQTDVGSPQRNARLFLRKAFFAVPDRVLAK
jgi:hypothetical protein